MQSLDLEHDPVRPEGRGQLVSRERVAWSFAALVIGAICQGMVVLKLAGKLDVSWAWIFAPVWGVLALAAGLFSFAGLLGAVSRLLRAVRGNS